MTDNILSHRRGKWLDLDTFEEHDANGAVITTWTRVDGVWGHPLEVKLTTGEFNTILGHQATLRITSDKPWEDCQ